MKRNGEALTAMKPAADAASSGAAFTSRIEEMIRDLQGAPALFPAGSGSGDTKAQPVIWSNNAGFTAAANETVARLQARHRHQRRRLPARVSRPLSGARLSRPGG